MAILVAGRVFGSEYERQVNNAFVLKAGLASELIEAVRLKRRPQFNDGALEVAHDVAISVHESRQIDGALYARTVEVIGEPALVDLIDLLRYYTLISLTINVYRVPPAGQCPTPGPWWKRERGWMRSGAKSKLNLPGAVLGESRASPSSDESSCLSLVPFDIG